MFKFLSVFCGAVVLTLLMGAFLEAGCTFSPWNAIMTGYSMSCPQR